ncbi:helix-turn-helix domain-containing protein [Mesorhizobium sp. CCNWLW179-1]|uniref:helix-turn-helix domain-containing protein n=1 Tax=unclassified Mesorhizobium TaxID=325217 RepID=UPI0030157D41
MRFDTMDQARVPRRSAAIMAGMLLNSGIDPDTISEAMRHLDRTPSDIDNGMVRAIDEWQAQRNFAELATNDCAFWLSTGLKYRLIDNGLVGLTWLTAPTLEQCTWSSQKYNDLLFTAARLQEIRQNGKLSGISFDLLDVPTAMRGFTLYHVLGGTLTALNDLWMGTFPISDIGIEFDRPTGGVESIEKLCNVNFGASINAVYWHPDLSEMPLFHGNSDMQSVYLRECDVLLKSARSTNAFMERAVAAVKDGVEHGQLSLSRVCSSIGMSERSFQRKLQERGYSFRDLSNMVRAQFARDLLYSGKWKVNEVAFRTGFSDSSSFSQAFLRWTGKRPGRFT